MNSFPVLVLFALVLTTGCLSARLRRQVDDEEPAQPPPPTKADILNYALSNILNKYQQDQELGKPSDGGLEKAIMILTYKITSTGELSETNKSAIQNISFESLPPGFVEKIAGLGGEQ